MKNNRTFLEKLLDGAEVEWKPLGDVCNFQNGFAFKSGLFKDNGSPIVRITNIDGKEVNLSDVKYFLLDDYNTDMTPYEVHQGDILIAMSGATTGKIGFYNYEHPSYLNQRVGKFLPNTNILNNRYLYHYLLSKVEDIYIISGGGAQPNLSSNRLMSEVLIPIPSLPIQTEIVKILDALTALTSELTSELILRRKQYEYYREKLLSEEELGKVGFEWKPLGEVTNIKTGQAVSKYAISQNPGIYPVINSGREPLGFINKWNTENDPIGITTRGAGVGSITWQEGKYFRGSLNYSVTIKSDCKLNVRFLYHILLHFQKEIHNLCSFTGIPALNASELKKLEISIPAIKEQQRIVSILDKFETLTNSINEGLPLAIEQSQKRYEYYRELLLNFS